MTTTMNKKDVMKARLKRHYEICAQLGKLTGSKFSGKKISTELFKLEKVAHAGATAYCNGENLQIYLPMPFKRAEGFKFHSDENAWERFSDSITECLKVILGSVPEGFFVNGDARGYALKIDPEHALPLPLHTDWGRYQILSPDLNEGN